MDNKSYSEHILPLRQTCNRCRELKVRCQRAAEDRNIEAGVYRPCVRCSKAGANCKYSPQQRSGRPPMRPRETTLSNVNNANRPKRSHRRHIQSDVPSTSSSHSGRVGARSSMMLSSTFFDKQLTANQPLLQPQNESQWQWEQGGMNNNFDVTGIRNWAAEQDSLQARDTPLNRNTIYMPDGNDVATRLNNLNMRILSTKGSSNDPTLCEEMSHATEALIDILSQVAGCCESSYTSSPGQPPFASHFDAMSSTGLKDAATTSKPPAGDQLGDYHKKSELPVALLVLSCYFGLYDLFRQVCGSILSQLHSDKTSSSTYSLINEGVPRVTAGPGKQQYSVSQIVMTLGLLVHLLGRLSRSRQRITSLFGSISDPVPSSHPTSTAKEVSVQKFGANPTMTPAIASVGVKITIDALSEVQASLEDAITTIKQHVEDMEISHKTIWLEN